MTSGGSGNECDRLNKRLAELISIKKKEQYCHVVAHVRTRLRFALLKSTLTAIRGYRGKADSSQEASVGEISFNLIPQERCYEIFFIYIFNCLRKPTTGDWKRDKPTKFQNIP